ncbi:MAG: ABC transporter substrate-binding protein [Planctomycetes bacterium]|nr:ABC transporter substrate-binding protein [Planctomycetota bacterium]
MKRFKKQIAAHLYAVFVLLTFFAFMSGCAKKEVEEIKIGVILPLTGDLANFGRTVLNGIELAMGDFSSTNRTRKIVLEVEDSQGRPSVAVSALRRLIDFESVRIVIGSLTSSSTLAMAPIAEEKRVILLSPTASHPALSKAGPYFYRVWPSDDFDGSVAARYSYDVLGARNTGIVHLNDDYATGLKNIYQRTFEHLGGRVLSIESYDESETDFRTILTKLKALPLDIIYIPGHPYGIGQLARQAKELNIQSEFLANVAAEDKDFLSVAGDAAVGMYFTAPTFSMSTADSLVNGFVAAYIERFKDEPDIHALKGYEAASVLLSAISEGNVDSDAIRIYIDRKKVFRFDTEILVFDAVGDVLTSISIKQYQQNGAIRTVDTIQPSG